MHVVQIQTLRHTHTHIKMNKIKKKSKTFLPLFPFSTSWNLDMIIRYPSNTWPRELYHIVYLINHEDHGSQSNQTYSPIKEQK